jgi:DNA-binding MarR family transcriptional regulator
MNRDIIDELQSDWNVQRPDLDAEAMGVVLRIQTLAKLLGEQVSDCLRDFDLQWWQYDVLSALRRRGRPYRMAATELADATRLTSGAMTNRIDRLEESGLVRRLEDPQDRRRVLVQLSRKGLRVVEDATAARFQAATEALQDLDQRKRAQLSNLLRLVLLAQDE